MTRFASKSRSTRRSTFAHLFQTVFCQDHWPGDTIVPYTHVHPHVRTPARTHNSFSGLVRTFGCLLHVPAGHPTVLIQGRILSLLEPPPVRTAWRCRVRRQRDPDSANRRTASRGRGSTAIATLVRSLSRCCPIWSTANATSSSRRSSRPAHWSNNLEGSPPHKASH